MDDRACGLRLVRPGTPYLTPRRDGARRPGPGPALDIGVRREPGCAVITVAGEIDIATVARLREQLNRFAAAGVAVVADLDQVSFIDASGLGALAAAAALAAGHGASLRVACSRRHTRRLFRLTGLDRPVPLAGTVAEALTALAAGQGAVPAGSGESAAI